MNPLPAYAVFPIINSGVDWLTCTEKCKGVSSRLWDLGIQVLNEERAGSGQILPARRLGFVGHKTKGVFLGQRPGDVMLQLSGPRCTPLAQEAIMRSTNVSRIDLQVTIWTEGEQVDLAGWSYKKLLSLPRNGPQVGGLTLITSWPCGDTLGINRRASDRYGRLYDKAAESGLGERRLLWRYELELKGKEARRQAARLGEYGVHPSHVNKLVHDFYTEKGLLPAFPKATLQHAFGPSIDAPTRDVLTWFRVSLSKTVSKAIDKHGREVVLEALGLLKHT